MVVSRAPTVTVKSGYINFATSITEEEWDQKPWQQWKSPGTASVLEGLFFPVRTNNLRNFARDLFLPKACDIIATCIHSVKELDSKVARVFASVFFLILGSALLAMDLVTSPIRILTSPYRIWTNLKREESDLRKYLESKKIPFPPEADTIEITFTGPLKEGTIPPDSITLHRFLVRMPFGHGETRSGYSSSTLMPGDLACLFGN